MLMLIYLKAVKEPEKKQVALQLAKSFFCMQRTGVEPCQVCPNCKRIDHGNHPDLHLIQPDGQSIKKYQVEHLQKEFTYRGMESNQKVYLIEQADLLTASAANSLLKFLEEPTAPTLALLLTENSQSMLPTIHSRSQQLVFAALPREALIERLEEHGVPSSISATLASLTTSLEEAVAFNENGWIVQAQSVMIQLMEELYERPSQVLFTLQEKWLPLFKERREQDLGLDLILLWLRDLLYIQVGKEAGLTFVRHKEQLQRQALSSSREKK